VVLFCGITFKLNFKFINSLTCLRLSKKSATHTAYDLVTLLGPALTVASGPLRVLGSQIQVGEAHHGKTVGFNRVEVEVFACS
jgi:hypothetical protein